MVLNRRSGRLVDGHLRVAEALRAGEKEVPVLIVDLEPEEERLMLASFDPIARAAITDGPALERLRKAVLEDRPDMAQLLAGLYDPTPVPGDEALLEEALGQAATDLEPVELRALREEVRVIRRYLKANGQEALARAVLLAAEER